MLAVKNPTTVIKNRIVGEPTTELDSEISGLPWGEDFTPRYGVDAITGGMMGAAVKPFTPEKKKGKVSSENCRFIQDENQLDSEIEVSASGKYNIQAVKLGASTSYLTKIKYSELTITLLAEYEVQYQGYDEAESYELTTEAQKLIGTPKPFRKAYGDYFIAGGRRCSRFMAVYTCQSTTAEEMHDFKASFGGEAPGVFSAEGSTRFMQATSRYHIDTKVSIFMEGYEGTAPHSSSWTPEQVIGVLNWFKDHEVGTYMQAKLKHYSQLDPSYSRTVDVAPSAFVDLRQLYTMLWDIRSRYASCPAFYQSQLKKEYTALDAGVVANQAVLATDTDLRLEYLQRSDAFLPKLDDVFARMDFYFKVHNAISTEPRKDEVIEEGKGQQTWCYGYSTYTKSPAVQISSQDMHYAAQSQFARRQDHTFEYNQRGQTLIVGWEVISNWNDGTNGSWKKVMDQNLLTDHAAVYVQSLLTRGCDWSFRVYYVDAKDYQFQDELDDMENGRPVVEPFPDNDESDTVNLTATFGSVLQQQSIWTWNVMQMGYNAGRDANLVPGEVTITDINLLSIQVQSDPNTVIMRRFTGHEESQNGADWAWIFIDRYGRQIKMFVQAKKLDLWARDPHYAELKYEQAKKLLNIAREEGAHPAYVFYNYSPTLGNPNENGCMMANADFTLEKMIQGNYNTYRNLLQFAQEGHVWPWANIAAPGSPKKTLFKSVIAQLQQGYASANKNVLVQPEPIESYVKDILAGRPTNYSIPGNPKAVIVVNEGYTLR